MESHAMSWILLSIVSAILLGCYDIAKKSAVKDNAVPPVLLLNVLTAALIWIPWVVWSYVKPDQTAAPQLSDITAVEHGLLICKSVLVGASWTLAFFALKHLPISIASPIRSTSPLWTIGFAVAAMGERPSRLQWAGVAVIVVAFLVFSRVGRREGIHFHRDRWVAMMIAATLLGAFSAVYDKYLLQTVGLSPAVVQAWFSIYLVPVMLPLAIRWFFVERRQTPFNWRWSIPMIAVLLLAADFTYFTAVAQPDALISVISPLRRTSVVVAFVFGILRLGEQSWRAKAVCIIGILCGVCLLSL